MLKLVLPPASAASSLARLRLGRSSSPLPAAGRQAHRYSSKLRLAMATTAAAPSHNRAVTKKFKVMQIDEANGQAFKKNIVLFPGNWELYDPFLMMAEDWMQEGNPNGSGFDSHPHRGFETVTFVVDGTCKHKDSRGNQGVLEAGDIQWMTAGKAGRHCACRTPSWTRCRTLHAAVAQPASRAQNVPASLPECALSVSKDIRNKDMPVIESDGGLAKAHVWAGRIGGVQSSTKTYIDNTIAFDARVAAGSQLDFNIPSTHNAIAYVFAGKGAINGETVACDDVVVLNPSGSDAGREDRFAIASDGSEDLRCVFFAGKPIKEPVVQKGPFVMNTNSEVAQAFSDYRNGLLA
eukprot:jgi/Chlat1/1632/Chrsp127S01890